VTKTSKRVCILTGASGPFGLAFCRAYCARYAFVAVYNKTLPRFPSQYMSYIDPLNVKAELPANVNRVWAVQADLQDDDAAPRIVDAAMSRYGRVDLLVNAAALSYRGSMLDDEYSADIWSDQSDINVGAPLRLTGELCRRAWRNQVDDNRRHRRHVVNISSTAGINVYPGQRQSEYAASKAALIHASLHLSDELAMIGVRVNVIAPNAFPQIVAVDDVAKAVVDLDAGSATGEVVVVDSDGTYAMD
jgi:NAD(P)-dependent dehydrogenase (short-subunit alcohol dehydrogenase family)